MATATLGGSLSASDEVRSIFITGVKNAHALEKEAIQILERQLERLKNYPEMETLIRRHLEESRQHEQRIDEVLDGLGEDRSLLKDLATQFMGNMAAIAHVPMPDEILKNTFANHAFENFEVASYKSLIVMAEAAGESRFLTALNQNLREDENAAQMIKDMVEPITRKYLERAASGAKADR
jgi:ferritin-like metal-binding protein YciE